MKRCIFIFLAFIFLFPQPVFATEIAGASGMLKENLEAVPDTRVSQLKGYLETQGSPLAPYSWDFIQMADHYRIDWRLLPAIAGIESSFGKRMIFQTYNAWGWGGGLIRFASWEESIEAVSKALREKYYDRGLDTPQKINPVYCPPNQTWGYKVNRFMEEISQYKENYSLDELALIF